MHTLIVVMTSLSLGDHTLHHRGAGYPGAVDHSQQTLTVWMAASIVDHTGWLTVLPRVHYANT